MCNVYVLEYLTVGGMQEVAKGAACIILYECHQRIFPDATVFALLVYLPDEGNEAQAHADNDLQRRHMKDDINESG